VWVRGGLTSVAIYVDYQLEALHPRAKAPGERHTILDHLPPDKVPGLTTSRESCAAHAATIGPSTAEVVARLLAERPIDRLPSVKRLLDLEKTYGAPRLERACRRALQPAATGSSTTGPARPSAASWRRVWTWLRCHRSPERCRITHSSLARPTSCCRG
jgi:hypothetical protein